MGRRDLRCGLSVSNSLVFTAMPRARAPHAHAKEGGRGSSTSVARATPAWFLLQCSNFAA